MSSAVLLLTLQSHKLRENSLSLRIGELQSQKLLATYSQGDVRAIKAQEEQEVRDLYKSLYNDDEEYSGKYSDYTEIPDFQEEMDRIAAKYQDELDALNAWETQLEAEITTSSAQLEELKAYDESYKGWLTNNINNEYKLTLS